MNYKQSYRHLALLSLSCVCFACQSVSVKNGEPMANKTVVEKPQANSYNWLQPGFKSWAFKNMDKLFATERIAKGASQRTLNSQLLSFDDLQIEQENGHNLSFREHLAANHTDGLLVLQQGNILAEEYLGDMNAESFHNWFSMSKSFTALAVGVLAAEGKIDLNKPTLYYLPSLQGTAWQGTTVQMVMDMTVGIQFKEDYENPVSDVYQFARAARFLEFEGLPSDFNSVPEYLKTVQQEGEHDQAFHYVSLNTEVLGMIISKVTGKQPAQIMSEKIWSKLGAEHDAFIVESPNGLDLVSAAINSTLRDAGRFGQMVLDNGMVEGQQVVPEEFIELTAKGGSQSKFAPSKRGIEYPGFSYKNQFWHTDGPAYFAKGLFGQWLYIHPELQVVIVKYSTSDIPSPAWTNDIRLMQAVCKRIASL